MDSRIRYFLDVFKMPFEACFEDFSFEPETAKNVQKQTEIKVIKFIVSVI